MVIICLPTKSSARRVSMSKVEQYRGSPHPPPVKRAKVENIRFSGRLVEMSRGFSKHSSSSFSGEIVFWQFLHRAAATHLRTALMGRRATTTSTKVGWKLVYSTLQRSWSLYKAEELGNGRVPGSRPAQPLTLGSPLVLYRRSPFYNLGSSPWA